MIIFITTVVQLWMLGLPYVYTPRTDQRYLGLPVTEPILCLFPDLIKSSFDLKSLTSL